MADKLVLLSNITISSVTNKLKQCFKCPDSIGYGNLNEELLNPYSQFNNPEFGCKVLFIDLLEFVHHDFSEEVWKDCIDDFFELFSSKLTPENSYFLNTVDMRCVESYFFVDSETVYKIENYWQEKLFALVKDSSNVNIYDFKRLVLKFGAEHIYSQKLWYLGKIVFSQEGTELVANEIKNRVELLSQTCKKVLLLDLDNTLWGGLAGENDNSPIELSDDKTGAIYKDVQRFILPMKNQGVLLCIVSKNNYDDAIRIIQTHPHMILGENDFVIKKINWEQKSDSIKQIAQELNLGLDSMVFIDDNPTERELVRTVLGDVVVPEYPKSVIDLLPFYQDIYDKYFRKLKCTSEDFQKTQSYQQNSERKKLEARSLDFYSYLQSLEICIKRVDAQKNIERIAQLIGKTNQFNLTTKRYEQSQVAQMMSSNEYLFYVFNVSDKFGDYGLVAIVIVKISDMPEIDSFIMSCRIMGKQIENAIVDFVEQDLKSKEFEKVKAFYRKTAKNAPVEKLYDSLGYSILNEADSGKDYILDLAEIPKRAFRVKSIE